MSGISSIRLDLREDPDLARDLELIRKHYRVGNYTDAVRIAISEMARIIRDARLERPLVNLPKVGGDEGEVSKM